MTPRRGFSLVELLVVISIIALLVALLSPALTKTKARAKQLQCVHQLRQLGIGFHGFAHDHNSQFPMSVPTDAGGSQEFAENGRRATGEFFFSYRHFQALSNDLSSAKVLACPADTRKPTLSPMLLDNTHLSYFVGINASLEQPTAILVRSQSYCRLRGRNDQPWPPGDPL
ncbi:MAG: type II secretion system protein [Verrucomicrobiota bacterium]